MPDYTDAQDGLFISTVPNVFNIAAVRGSIFYAVDGNYQSGTRTLWPPDQRNRRENWVLRSSHFTEGQVLPLSRRLLLDYLAQRPVTPRTGTLSVVVDGEQAGVLLRLGAPLHPEASVQEYGDTVAIGSDEADRLATFAARWWSHGGTPPPPPPPMVPTEVAPRSSQSIVVVREWEEPDATQAQTTESVVDGVLVRTTTLPIVQRQEEAVYLRKRWVEHCLMEAGRQHSVRDSINRMLGGEEIAGLVWHDLPLVVWDEDLWVRLADVETMSQSASTHYAWCATAKRVMGYLAEGESSPRWSGTIRMREREREPWLREEYLGVQFYSTADTQEEASSQGLARYSAYSGIPAETLRVETIDRSDNDYSRNYQR